MSLNTLSTGSAAGLFLPLTDDASSSEAPGSDSAMNDSDLLLAMDNLFLQQIYNLIAATYGNTPISESGSDVPGLGTPSADDVQAGQPIEKRTSWPSPSTPFDAKDIKGIQTTACGGWLIGDMGRRHAHRIGAPDCFHTQSAQGQDAA